MVGSSWGLLGAFQSGAYWGVGALGNLGVAVGFRAWLSFGMGWLGASKAVFDYQSGLQVSLIGLS